MPAIFLPSGTFIADSGLGYPVLGMTHLFAGGIPTAKIEGADMPAVSEAQRRMLNAHFGHAWVKEHHFDNKGKLPARVKGRKHAKRRKGKR